MEPSDLRCAGSAITVTTDIVRSESPRMTNPTGYEHGSKGEDVEQRQQRSAEVASRSKLASRAGPLSIKQVEGHFEPCAGPVIPGKRNQKALSPVGLQSGFEESPEWREHYDPNSERAKTEGPYMPDGRSRLLPNQSLMNAKNFSTETIITAKTLSDRISTDTDELSSKKLLCLPRPPARRNLLKAGNIRWQQFIRPKYKTYFRKQPVPEDQQDNVEQLQKLDLTGSKKDLLRRGSENRLERIVKEKVISSRKSIRNKESSTSIVDLNQVEARHGLEKYHRTNLSQSWDEIFKSMGGFMADSAIAGDNGHQNGQHSASTVVDVMKSDLPTVLTSPSKHESNEPRSAAVKSPLLPGPRTLSIAAMANGSPTRQSFQVVVAELPAGSTPTRQLKPKSTNQENSPLETDMNFLRVEHSLVPSLRQARSSAGLSTFGPGPDASQSTIALEAIEAEMNNGRPLSPSTLTRVTQPFSVNCTPPQPATAPTDPPIGPLPELPEEFDRADAASRASSHHSSPTRLSRPIVPPRSHHRRNPSSNSTSSNLTLRAMNSPTSHHRKDTSISNRSPKKASSIRSAQNVPAGGTSSRADPQPKLALSMSNSANITGFDQFNLGSSQDLRSPAASGAGPKSDMVGMTGAAADKSPFLFDDVLLPRTEQIKRLKMRDLASEKATRFRSRHQGSELDDRIVVEKPSLAAVEDTTTPTLELPDIPLVPGKPAENSHDIHTVDSRPASRQASVTRRPSYVSRRSSSHRASQRTIRPVMNHSQIMVLAETDPDTQMFRASTPTGLIRRTDGKVAESAVMATERKVRKRKSKTSVPSQVHTTAAPKGLAGIKPNGEHTPPHSDPSTHSSDDDISSPRRTTSRRGMNHIAALVKEESDIESAPAKRGFAALSRKEEKKYFKEQLLLKRLKCESSELKLAIRLLSRGLKKLTTFVEADEELDEVQSRRGLMAAEMAPVMGMAERLGRALGPDDDWEGFSQGPPSLGKDGGDAGFRRKKRARANDARPISLVSRYSSVRNSMGESVIAGPAIKDEVIWDQVDGLNRSAMINRGSSR